MKAFNKVLAASLFTEKAILRYNLYACGTLLFLLYLKMFENVEFMFIIQRS